MLAAGDEISTLRTQLTRQEGPTVVRAAGAAGVAAAAMAGAERAVKGSVFLPTLANFILVPLAAYIIRLVIPLDEPFGIGLILLATAAGAPFLPKLAQATI